MNKTVRFLLLYDICTIAGFGLILPIFSVFVKENLVGGSLLAAGFATAIFLITKSFFQVPFARYVDEKDESFDLFWLIFGGFIICFVPFIYIFSSTIHGIFFAQFLYGVGSALVYPTWLKSWNTHLDAHHETFEWSFYSSSVSLGSAAASILGAWFASRWGFELTFVLVGLLSFTGFLCLWFLRSYLVRQKKEHRGIVLDFPELRQTYNYDCGASALESVLAYYGIEVREDKIMNRAKTNSEDGTTVEGMLQTLKHFGLKTVSREMTLHDVKKFLDNHIPVILLLQAWTESKHVNWKKDWIDGHYVVAIGYDKSKIYFEDPSSFERTFLTFTELRDRWHDVDGKTKKYYNYGIAVYVKKPKFSGHRVIHMD